MITPEQYINYRCVRDVEKKAKKDPYLGTPFIAVRNLSSRSKGAFFEKLTKEWLSATFDLYSNKPSSSQHDTIINDVKIEIKGSTLWVDGEVVAIASFPPEDQDGLIDAFDWAQDTAARLNLTLTLE